MGNADIIRAHYAASDRGDLKGMLAPLAHDVRWTEAEGFPYAGTFIGPEAVAENVFASIQRDIDGFTLTVDEVIDGGDTIVGLGTYAGTVRATGRSFEARVAHIWHLTNGRVATFEQVTDTEVVNRAVRNRD